MKNPSRLLGLPLLCVGLAIGARAETLDSLREYGDAATTPAPNAAGNSHGADFTNAAAGEYTITAGGEDFWSPSDHGTFIFDSTTSRAAAENFSAVVRSVSVAADPLEVLAGEWGRTGIMARKNPDNPASANVAHVRKTGGGGGTLLQWRPNDGAGTTRGANDYGYHNNVPANTANGSVRDTPIWLALHRYNGTWYSTWAEDNNGSPAVWSDTRSWISDADMSGDVWVGLAHQSHRNEPHTSGGNTAVFDNFTVSAFDNSLGDFPPEQTAEVTFNGKDVFLTASANELGGGAAQDVEWEVRFLGTDVPTPGRILADIYMGGNNAANRTAMSSDSLGTPNGSVIIPNMSWSGSSNATGGTGAYPDPSPDVDNSPGPNLFAQAVPGSFTGNQDNYGVHMTGEIHIPSDADRDGVESIRFHDGCDDYTFLEVGGFAVIDHNGWTNWEGTGNNGGTQGTLDVSDPKFDDGEWVSIRAGMWEGGGGDHCNFTWDALDRTGSDSVTGAVDDFQGSYNPGDLPDGVQVNFNNDPSDQIPSQNLRTLSAGVVEADSGNGQPNNFKLPTPITEEVTFLEVYLDGALFATIPVLPSMVSANFTSHTDATIVLTDAGDGGTSDIDRATLTVTRDGAVISPTVTEDGVLTTIVDSFAPDRYAQYTYQISGTTTAATGGQDFSFSATVTSFPIAATLRDGLGDPPNASVGWDYMEFAVVPTLGGNLGADAQGFRDAQFVIANAVDPAAREVQPYVNHGDPETNGASGDWVPDLTILTDTPADDQQYVTYARTVISIADGEQGDYTFRIRGDDGYGLRVTGAEFTSVAGNGTNTIHPVETSSAFFPGFTGDTDAFAVCNFPSAGDYPVEFFAFEGGGGSFQEIAWAPGAHTSLSGSTEWALVGNTGNFVPESLWGEIPESVIPPLPTDEGGWSVHIWYDAQVGSLTNTMNYLRGIDAGTATFSAEFVGVLPYLDHKDDANGGNYNFPNNDPFPGDPTNPGDTQNIAMIAHARLVAPVDGDYTIQINSDDGFLFRFFDETVRFDGLNTGANGQLNSAIPNEIFHPTGTGNTNTRAWLNLAAGEYDVVYVWWEGGGGSSFEISTAPGVIPTHGPAFELLTAQQSNTNLYLGKAVPPPFDITSIVYDQGADEFTLTWDSDPGATYAVFWSQDAQDWGADIDDSVPSQGEETSLTFGNPSPGLQRMLFRVELGE